MTVFSDQSGTGLGEVVSTDLAVMRNWCAKLVLLIIVVAILLIVISYGMPQSEFRANSRWSNRADVSYDLAFLELTERGNLFHRERLIELERYVKQQSNTLMIVFLHGWRHNAREGDGNVKSFRRLLHNLASVNGIGGKRLLSVYIGWPGLSTQAATSCRKLQNSKLSR